MAREKGLRRLSYERKKRYIGLLFIAPWILGTVWFFAEPVVESFLYSIGELKAIGGLQLTIIGWDHYVRAFTQDSSFLPLLASNIPPLLYQIPIILVFSLFQAILINQKFVGRTFVRAVFFLPIIIANGIIITIINGDAFSQIMTENTGAGQMFKSEMLSILLKEMNIGTGLAESVTGVVDALFSLLWKSGIQTLLFLAALQTVPVSMYEAARMEGGTAWENFWKITFPMLSPTILINLIFSIIDTFNDYGNGVVSYINNLARKAFFEYSSCLSWIYTVLIVALMALTYWAVNRFVYYEV